MLLCKGGRKDIMKRMLFGVFLILLCFIPALAVAAPFAYITNNVSDTVSVIDTTTNTVIGTPIAVGDFPVGIAVNPAGTLVYVANGGSNTVSVIDTATNTVIGVPIAVGNFPTGIAVNPAGTMVYVANTDSGTVSVIDTATNTVIGAPIDVGDNPIAFGLFIGGPAATATPTAIPTMTEWGMIFFVVLAGLGAVYYLGRQRRTEH
jgi:YVTN family beta-propeller protein